MVMAGREMVGTRGLNGQARAFARHFYRERLLTSRVSALRSIAGSEPGSSYSLPSSSPPPSSPSPTTFPSPFLPVLLRSVPLYVHPASSSSLRFSGLVRPGR